MTFNIGQALDSQSGCKILVHTVLAAPSDTARSVTTVENVLGAEHGERVWLAAAQSYGRALATGAVRGVAPGSANRSAAANLRVVSIHTDVVGLSSLEKSLDDAYRQLAAGDIVLLNLAGRTSLKKSAGMDRDFIARMLSRAGFDCPLMWAGRDVLKAETQRSPVLNALLPTSALGAGPFEIPNVEGRLRPPADRVVAMARRSELAPPGERQLRLSIILPVYNEHKTFRDVMDRLLTKAIPGFDIEICLVESNSTDGTREHARQYSGHPRVRLLLEDKPSGKGHAVRKGLELATGDIVLIQDADLEYDLDDYEKLLEPIRAGRVSFVLGSRHPAGEKSWQIRHFADQRGIADVMNVGHLFFTWFLNVTFGQRLRDPFTMYKVFRRGCIHNVRFECNRFDFDHELVGKLVRQGFGPIEIPIRYESRSFNQGKKVSMFGDPPTWIKACLKHRFSNLHVWPESS